MEMLFGSIYENIFFEICTHTGFDIDLEDIHLCTSRLCTLEVWFHVRTTRENIGQAQFRRMREVSMFGIARIRNFLLKKIEAMFDTHRR